MDWDGPSLKEMLTCEVVVLSLALGLALSPCPLMGQEEEKEEVRDWTSGIVTGGVVGLAASALAGVGLCAASDDQTVNGWNDFGTCAMGRAGIALIPALATGTGLAYPDRVTTKARLRVVALGAAGGFLFLAALAAVVDGVPVDALVIGTLWGTGVGLVSGPLGPPSRLSCFRPPRPPKRGPRCRSRSGWPSAAHSRSVLRARPCVYNGTSYSIAVFLRFFRRRGCLAQV